VTPEVPSPGLPRATYGVTVSRFALRQLRRLDPQIRQRLRHRIDGLPDDPRPAGVVKLVGTDRTWRLRVGDYRILFDIDDDARTIEVVDLGHRRDVYR
jgi:mRNA interferase RelE/StbE